MSDATGKLTFLYVPIGDKEQVKALGAKWHSGRKQWFVEGDLSQSSDLYRWKVPKLTNLSLRARCPFYLVESIERCWKCSHPSKVITFAAAGLEAAEPGQDYFTNFAYVDGLTENLKRLVSEEYSSYFVDFSRTTNSFYYINHCEKCAAVLGDHYMHHEPGGAFFPNDEQDATKLKLIELKSEGFVRLGGQPSVSLPSLIEMGVKINKRERSERPRAYNGDLEF